jgi:hypothetical protein
MGSASNNNVTDRRQQWTPTPRPAWLAKFNEIARLVDIKSIVPLDVTSLLHQARLNTNLDDFGDDGWLEHFQVLLEAIDDEADLNFFGRIQTRSEFLVYLQARLQIIDTYRQHPEIEHEVIKEPVFILGFGRSGTTILHEVLSQDPQFRSVQRWEAMFPCPPPEAASYETDGRINRTEKMVELIHEISPEWKSMHAQGAQLPVEDIEFTYSAFFSEVWINAFCIPSYERYFAGLDPKQHFDWHKKFLKLLQWKYKKAHWLLKNPTHMPRLAHLLKAYPDAKIILPHRDPITSTDSVVNVSSAIYHWRTDQKIPVDLGNEWMQADSRARVWDEVIELIESGALRKGFFANILYADFIKAPRATLEQAYRDLGLDLQPEDLNHMLTYMDMRNQGSHGNSSKYEKTAAADPRAVEERKIYQRYQRYFSVPDEL